MKKALENKLGRKLSSEEQRYIEWMERQDRETQEMFASLFGAMYKAGLDAAIDEETK